MDFSHDGPAMLTFAGVVIVAVGNDIIKRRELAAAARKEQFEREEAERVREQEQAQHAMDLTIETIPAHLMAHIEWQNAEMTRLRDRLKEAETLLGGKG